MRFFGGKLIIAVPTLLIALVLSNCGHTSGSEVARDVGKSVLVEVAEIVIAKDCNDTEVKSRTSCGDQSEAVRKLGQSLYGEIEPADDSPSAEELSNDLDTFIEHRRTPAGYSKDDSEDVSSP